MEKLRKIKERNEQIRRARIRNREKINASYTIIRRGKQKQTRPPPPPPTLRPPPPQKKKKKKKRKHYYPTPSLPPSTPPQEAQPEPEREKKKNVQDQKTSMTASVLSTATTFFC